MKKISRSIGFLVLLASFSLPVFASAANSGGCSSAGPGCMIGTINGICAQNTDTGDFYCKAIDSTPAGACSGGCCSAGPTCTILNPNDGTCAQNIETGDYYCRSNGTGVTPGPTPGPTTVGTPPANAAGSVNQKWIVYYYQTIIVTVNQVLVPILIAIAFIVFLWGIFKYFIWHGESESEKAEGRLFAMWGIIGFVVILSIWGIVNMVKDTLVPSTASSTHPTYPTL